jgi:hypothetical protein
MVSNKLRQIVKEIQFKKDLTIEQIAQKAGYTRVHLTKELKKESSPKVEAKLLEVFKDSLHNDANQGTESIQKNPTDEAGLIQELLESQRARIKLLEERQQSETRLIQVEATLNIIVGILKGLKLPEQSRTPSAKEVMEEIEIENRAASKNESSSQKAERK